MSDEQTATLSPAQVAADDAVAVLTAFDTAEEEPRSSVEAGQEEEVQTTGEAEAVPEVRPEGAEEPKTGTPAYSAPPVPPAPMPVASAPLVNMARQLGVSDQIIQQLGTDERIEGYLRARMESQPQTATRPSDAEAAGLPEFAPFVMDATMEGDDLDDRMVNFSKGVRGMNDHYSTQVGKLHATVRTMQDTMERVTSGMLQHQDAQMQNWFDERVQRLVGTSPEWRETFGEGSMTGLKDTGSRVNRQKLFDWFRSQASTPNMTPDQTFDFGLNGLFANVAQKRATAKTARKTNELAEQGTPVPTARASDSGKSASDKAEDAVRRTLRKFGAD